MNIDWCTYRETFPAKYIKEGTVDGFIWKHIVSINKKNLNILEIGSGKYLSSSVSKAKYFLGAKIYTYDKYVLTRSSDHVFDSIFEIIDSRILFDVIVMRGSFNYRPLEREHYFGNQIFPGIVAPEGLVLFNTFHEPTKGYTFRGEVKDIHGRSKEETIFYNKEFKTITHYLNFSEEDEVKHSFYYISEDDINKMFSIDGGTIKKYEHEKSLYYAIKRGGTYDTVYTPAG